jgi:hypothetical protein
LGTTLTRTGIGLNETELETAWLGAGRVPADARNWHSWFDNAASGGDNTTERIVEVGDRDRDLGHRSSAGKRGVPHRADSTIDSRLGVGTSADSVVFVGHVELLEPPTEGMLEELFRADHVVNREIEVRGLSNVASPQAMSPMQ